MRTNILNVQRDDESMHNLKLDICDMVYHVRSELSGDLSNVNRNMLEITLQKLSIALQMIANLDSTDLKIETPVSKKFKEDLYQGSISIFLASSKRLPLLSQAPEYIYTDYLRRFVPMSLELEKD